VEVDPGLIQQVLVNLIYNAGDAVSEIPENRRICVSTYFVDGAPEPTLGVTVVDNGPGVRRDREPLLFKKRFTTKPNGHGIGLITCRKILDTHLGDISYRFADGASFSMTLPIGHGVVCGDLPGLSEHSPAGSPV